MDDRILLLFYKDDTKHSDKRIIVVHKKPDYETEAWALLANSQTDEWKQSLNLRPTDKAPQEHFYMFDQLHYEVARRRLIEDGWKSPFILGKIKNCVYTIPIGF
jgi:hypothetical protein